MLLFGLLDGDRNVPERVGSNFLTNTMVIRTERSIRTHSTDRTDRSERTDKTDLFDI